MLGMGKSLRNQNSILWDSCLGCAKVGKLPALQKMGGDTILIPQDGTFLRMGRSSGWDVPQDGTFL